MDLDVVVEQAIWPAYALLPSRMDSDRATVMLLAIGLQESRFEHRRQIKGPARGFWQFERGGGVRGVLTHPATAALAREVCVAREVLPTSHAVYDRLEHDDVLAAAFARLLLWTDPPPLPPIPHAPAAWSLYLRTWRPGKPHRHTWDALYQRAVDTVAGLAATQHTQK